MNTHRLPSPAPRQSNVDDSSPRPARKQDFKPRTQKGRSGFRIFRFESAEPDHLYKTGDDEPGESNGIASASKETTMRTRLGEPVPSEQQLG